MQKKSLLIKLVRQLFLVFLLFSMVACQKTGDLSIKENNTGVVAEVATAKTEQEKEEAESQKSSAAQNTENNTESESEKTEEKKEEVIPDTYHELSFLAVGDVMVHKEQLKRAYVPESDSFDFTESFSYIKPFIDSADYAFANLETTLAGRSKHRGDSASSYQGYSGYPNFNAPESLADALKWAGFDFIGTANNHSLDKGLNGVINTLAYLRQINLPYTGTFDTIEERNSLKVVEVGGLKIGVIAYTYATNGLYLKAEEMYRVNTLDNYNAKATEKLYADVEKAKKEPIDLLFVMMHYGNEYWEKPEKHYQAGITQKLIDLGVDMIIGSHPHTLQPIIYTENNSILLNKSMAAFEPTLANPAISDDSGISATENKDGDTAPKSDIPIHDSGADKSSWNISGIFSLGNFISSQRVVSEYRTDTDTGALIKWVYQWKNDEKPVLVKVGILPTIVVWQNDRATVLPIDDKSIEAAKADKTMAMTPYVDSRITNAKNTVQKRLTAFLPDSLIQSMQTEEDGFTYLYLHPEIKK